MARKVNPLIDELNNLKTNDFDPEDVTPYENGDEDSELEDDEGADKSRFHYEVVGKSKLRKPQAVSLGPQYSGSRISRTAIRDEDEDDPFTRQFDDDESGEGNVDYDLEDGDEVEASDGEEVESESQSHEEEEPKPDTNGIDRAEIRKLMAYDHKTVAANLSKSARADAEKGQAVKKQRAAFDALLNLRIKLQRALIAVNSIPVVEQQETTIKTNEQAMCMAESAAITLFNNLTSLRESLDTARSGKKRKYTEISPSVDIEAIWEENKSTETRALPDRNSTLDFWSTKCRATTAALQTRKLGVLQNERSLSDVLNGHVSDMQRLVSRTRVPRSCAPIQASHISRKQEAPTEPDTESLPIYDDADFYSVLLQNLISQRSDESTSLSLQNITIMEPWQAAREAKVKKVVDTRASKGRKLRYTVHEKLQNFMAPEDRTSWGQRQCDDLFGSLFGRKVGLNERDGEEDVDVEVEGLRLFAGT